MSKLTDDIRQYTNTIEVSLQRLVSERDKLRIRLSMVQQMECALHNVLQESDEMVVIEQLEEAVVQHEAIASDIASYLQHFDKELTRIKRGFAEANTLGHSSAKRAFLAYITDDLTLSLINVRQTRQEYNEVFTRLKELIQFWM